MTAESLWYVYLLGAGGGFACFFGCLRQACREACGCTPGPNESYAAMNEERQELLAANSQPGSNSAGIKPSAAVLSPQMHGR